MFLRLLLVYLLLISFDAWAQEEQGIFSRVQEYSSEEPSPLERVLVDAQDSVNMLLEENDRLMKEHAQLTVAILQEEKKLKESQKNAVPVEEAVERPSTDDIDAADPQELKRMIHANSDQIVVRQNELQWLDKKLDVLRRKVELSNLKLSELELRKKKILSDQKLAQSMTGSDNLKAAYEMVNLKDTLAREKQKEKVLEQKLIEVSKGQEGKPSVNQLKEQNELLKEEILNLQNQKEKKLNELQPQVKMQLSKAQPEQKEYWEMIQKKIDLEGAVDRLQRDIQFLKDPDSQKALDADKTQKVDQVMEIDDENQMVMEQIGHLRENVEILRAQIKNLEQRVNP